MQNARKIINSQQLRQFTRLDKLSDEDAKELLQTSITLQLSAGSPIFSQSNKTKQMFFLIEGELKLTTSKNPSLIISANTEKARQAFGSHIKGQLSASAKTDVTLLSFDTDMMDLFINWANPDAYLVNEMAINKSNNGLERLLQSRGLLRFTEEQIKNLLNRMKEIHFSAGDTIIKQNEYDEYYYIVKNGRCSVSRQPDKESSDVKLAELKEGDAFGEEAILTSAPRNANVKMIEDGDLMRLSKKDFSEFLAEPLLETISADQSHEMLTKGAVFIDVRLPEEFSTSHIPGSINIPVNLLRLKLSQLSQNRKYIVCCDDASRSAVATFLLSRNGFDAYILDGGLNTTPDLFNQSEPLLEDIVDEPEIQAQQEIDTITTPDNDNSEADDVTLNVESFKRSKPAIKSLAENWGNTVEESDENIFCDLRDVGTRGKTQPISPEKISEKTSTQSDTVTKNQIDPAINAAGFAELTRRKRQKRMIQSGIAMSFISIVAIFSLPLVGDKISQGIIKKIELPAAANYLNQQQNTAPTKQASIATIPEMPAQTEKQIIENNPAIPVPMVIPGISTIERTPSLMAPEYESNQTLIQSTVDTTATIINIPATTNLTIESMMPEVDAVDPSTRNIIDIE